MNIEKNFYSLIGCIVAAVIIQNSYNLKLSYMIGVVIILWGGCFAAHVINEKRIKRNSHQLEERNNELIQQTIEKLITTITTESKSTNKGYEDAMTSARTVILDKLDFLDTNEKMDRRALLEELSEKVLLELKKIDANRSKAFHDELTIINNSLKQYYLTETKKICDQFEKTGNQIEQVSREERKNILSCVNKLAESVSTGIVSIREDIGKANETLNCVLNTGKEFFSQANSIEKLIVDRNNVMTQTLTDFRTAIGEEINELNSSVSNAVHNCQEVFANNMKEASETLNGILSNIQNEVGDIDRTLESIQSCSNETNEEIDDLKGAISDARENMESILADISFNLQGSMDKQLEIVERYDDLLGKVNDEILVKIINDSNNVVQLLKDCYTMLEINRRARR